MELETLQKRTRIVAGSMSATMVVVVLKQSQAQCARFANCIMTLNVFVRMKLLMRSVN